MFPVPHKAPCRLLSLCGFTAGAQTWYISAVQASLTTGPRGEIVLIREGEIDLATADQLRSVGGEALIANPTADAHVDLSRVTFLDSTGIGALVHIRNLAAPRDLIIDNPSEPVRRILELTGLTETFRISPSSNSGSSSASRIVISVRGLRAVSRNAYPRAALAGIIHP
jgi:anti-sigma B factor antagonist